MKTESLRKIAEAATPGPWELSFGTKHPRVRDAAGRFILEPLPHGIRLTHDARHIATFSPSTVLPLLKIAEAAQAYRTARDNPRSGASAVEERTDTWAALCGALDALRALEGNPHE